MLTVHFLSVRSDGGSKAALEVYDKSAGSQKLLTRFTLKNDTRPASVSSSGKTIVIVFIPDAYKETYFTIKVTTGIGTHTSVSILTYDFIA